MLFLRVKAPFAAFRTFTAGYYRPTAPFITPSAAYGLIMNIAGIETRKDDGTSAMTLMREDLPVIEVAIGAVTFPDKQIIYQQLHNYPVGASARERGDECRGNKYNIQPVRREFLSGIDACLGVRAAEDIERLIKAGLKAEVKRTGRYGILFLGDNSFMPDKLEHLEEPIPARWLIPMRKDFTGPRRSISRLTVRIDRSDMTKTLAPLFSPLDEATPNVPEKAWIHVGPYRN
jgi:CRISPR-associated protein Cas5t